MIHQAKRASIGQYVLTRCGLFETIKHVTVHASKVTCPHCKESK